MGRANRQVRKVVEETGNTTLCNFFDSGNFYKQSNISPTQRKMSPNKQKREEKNSFQAQITPMVFQMTKNDHTEKKKTEES